MWSSMYASCRSTQHTYIHICMAMYLGKGAFDMNLHSRRESCVAFHTHSKVYTHRHIHTLDLAKVQKMTEIYGVWDTQHYDKVTHTTWLTYTQSCAKACTYTHCTHRVEIYSVGGVGVITRTPCSAAFNGFKQKKWSTVVDTQDTKWQKFRWENTGEKQKYTAMGCAWNTCSHTVCMNNWIHKHSRAVIL